MTFEDTIGMLLALVIVLGFAFMTLRHEKCHKLQLRFNEKVYALSLAVNQYRSLNFELQQGPSGLNKDNCKFVNSSLEEHKIAKDAWAKFLSTYTLAVAKLKSAQDFQHEVSGVPTWWRLPTLLEIALKNLFEGECKDLPDKLTTEATAAREAIQRFVTAQKTNDAQLCKLNNQISGNSKTIVPLFEELKLWGPTSPRYQTAVTNVQEQYLELEQSLKLDPLDPKQEAVANLGKQIAKLTALLHRALRLFISLEEMRYAVVRLETRIESMRNDQPLSTMTNVRYIQNGFTLDEPGFEVQSMLDDCRTLLGLMDKALLNRRLYSFSKYHKLCSTKTEQLKRLLAEILDDKCFVDEQMQAVKKQSTVEDRKSDRKHWTKIRRLYKAQHWHAAMLSVKEFLLEHTPRVQAREQVGKLADSFAQVLRVLQAYPNAISFELDAAFQLITTEISCLHQQAASSKADWASLAKEAQELDFRLVGSSPESLLFRGQAEFNAYEQAQTELNKLIETVRRLDEEFAFWCGEEAANKQQEVQKQASELIEDAKIIKQDWQQLTAQILKNMELLEEANTLLELAKEKHRLQELQIEKLEAQLSTCQKDEAYSRVICGTKFGACIYIQDEQPQKLLAKAKASLKGRDYESMHLDLQQARARLSSENVEAWWLCLQLMANSDVACARSFALKHGYTPGGFDLWSQEKLKTDHEELYVPSSHACAHKGGSAYPVIYPNDFPVMSDYEGGLVPAG